MPPEDTGPLDELAPTVLGRLATGSVPSLPLEETAAQAREALTAGAFESVADVVVHDDTGRPIGLVPIEDLLAADADAPLGSLVDRDPPIVAPGSDPRAAAWKAVDHRESSLIVLDQAGRFVGLVPPVRLLAVLLSEHDRDMARLGGYLHQTREARAASSESVPRRYWHRLPWLLAGLGAAMLAAVLVSSFEEDLARTVSLAFFLPGVVYIADAVGTQTETVVIRGLSVGVPVREVLGRELVTGLLIGATLGSVFLLPGTLLWSETDVAIAVAISMFAAASVATLVAMVLPAVFARMGRDPAFGSGPLATVAQDLLSIAVYFGVASVIV